MKKIFLCCAAGMSTSIVVKKMKQAASEKGIDVDIIAVGMEEFESTLSRFDGCLLGPQIKYKFEDFKAIAQREGKPIAIISNMDYGMLKGEKILDDALNMIRDFQNNPVQ